jgi:cytochrome c biogenesis protein CcmG, thiol:disulfide interchange protein DsbE
MSEALENMPVPESVSKRKRRRKVLIFGVISLLNVGLLILLITQLLTPASQANADPLVGHTAPTFALTQLSTQANAGTLSLADFRGKPIVLNFWASWCDPCKEEAPLLENAWKQIQAQKKDTIFLGIDFQETRGDALHFLQAYDISYPLALDTHGTVSGKYYITGLPDTIFINRDGTVVGKVSQQITAQLLTHNLQLIE